MSRQTCLLDNKELIEKILDLQKELYRDFSLNKLEECDICSKKLDADLRHDIHQKLIMIYNDLSEIKRKLAG